MIDVIHAQLSAWGKWVIRSESRAHGYPPVCPMFRDARSGRGEGRSTPPIGAFSESEAAESISAVVARLSLDRRVLCVEYYVVTGRHCDIAARMGISDSALHQRMHRMHEAVQDELFCESGAGGKGEK